MSNTNYLIKLIYLYNNYRYIINLLNDKLYKKNRKLGIFKMKIKSHIKNFVEILPISQEKKSKFYFTINSFHHA